MNRLAYRMLVACALPFALLAFAWRGIRDRGYWHALPERLGCGARTSAASIWVHAVSVGEVQAAAPLLRALRASHPGTPLVLTTATPAGAARARALFGTELDVRFLPLDTLGSVRRFFERIRPQVAIVIEKEIWPNLYHECGERGIPLVLASASLATRALPRYRRLASLFPRTLAQGTVIAAQTAADAANFLAIGSNPAATHVIGNLKFDLELPANLAASGMALRDRLGWQRRCVLVGGSTHEVEEEALLQVQRRLLAAGIALALVLAPRQPARFASVAEHLRTRGVRFARQSLLTAPSAGRSVADLSVETQSDPPDVLLLDSIGDLPTAYAAADIAFVGGSLMPGVGGHNLLEPAALGVATLTGPHGYNAADIVGALQAAGAVEVIGDAEALRAAVRRLADDSVERARRGERGRQHVAGNRGALQRLLALLPPIISPLPPGSGSPPASR